MTNQARDQTSSQSDDDKQRVERESVVKTRSGRIVPNQLGLEMMTVKVYYRCRNFDQLSGD